MKKIEPCGHYLLVRLDAVEEEETSEGGILIAKDESSKHSEQTSEPEAEVLGIGCAAWTGHQKPNGEWTGNWCKIGDKVIIAKYAGQAPKIPASATQEEEQELRRLRIIADEDVIARVIG